MTPLDIISLDQAKLFLRTDFNDDDSLITDLIYSAVALVEQKTQYRLYQRIETDYSDGTYNVDLFQQPLNNVTVTTLEGNPVTWCQVKRQPVRTTIVFLRSTFGPFSGYGNGFTGFGNGGFGDGFDNGVIFPGQGFPASLPLYTISCDVGYTNSPASAGYQDISQIPYGILIALKTIISYTYENRDMSKVDLPSNILMELESYTRNPMF
jgi:hypothetical protein